jgi:hypothetical protein
MKKIIVAVLAVALVCGVSMAQQKVVSTEVQAERILVPASKLFIGGTAVTATATQLNNAASGATVTQSKAAITATAVVTAQTAAIYDSAGVACTNAAGAAVAVITNATVAVTVVNGGSVVTNIAVSLTK